MASSGVEGLSLGYPLCTVSANHGVPRETGTRVTDLGGFDGRRRRHFPQLERDTEKAQSVFPKHFLEFHVISENPHEVTVVTVPGGRCDCVRVPKSSAEQEISFLSSRGNRRGVLTPRAKT